MAFKGEFRPEGTTQAKGRERIEVARLASRDCPFCLGAGMMTVYHPSYTPAGPQPFATRVQAHCQCELGEFIRCSWPEDLQRRTPRVADVITGRSKWSLLPPGEDLDIDNDPVTKGDFDAFWRRVRPVGQHWPANPGKHTHAEIAAGLQRRREREGAVA